MLSLKFARTLHLAETSRGRCWKREQNKFLGGGKEEDLAAEGFLSFFFIFFISFFC
jgi:hypothetical protein